MFLIPNNLDEFICNSKIAKRLKIYNKEYMENLIFYGGNNCGKRTLITGLLNHLSNNNITRNMRTHKIKINNNKIDINFVESKYHYELNLYEYGHYDKHIVSEFIKYILNYKNITNLDYKIIVLYYFDKVSKTAQRALRRIIEKSYTVGRFILCCEHLTGIDVPLLSRFIHVRVPGPKHEELEKYINITCKKNNKQIDPVLTQHIIELSKNSIYKINLILQHYIVINEITSNIINECDILTPIITEIHKPNLKSIEIKKKIIYKYLLLNFTPASIFKILSSYYIKYEGFSDEQQAKVIKISAELDYFRNNIKYDIFILETFILNIKLLLVE